jgi:hypothetical protein
MISERNHEKVKLEALSRIAGFAGVARIEYNLAASVTACCVDCWS